MHRSHSILAEFAPELLSWEIPLEETNNLFVLHSEHGGPIPRAATPTSDILAVGKHDTLELVQDKQLIYLAERSAERIVDCRKVIRQLMGKHTEGIVHFTDLLPQTLEIDVRTRRALIRLTTTIPNIAYIQDQFQAEYLSLIKEAYSESDTHPPTISELVASYTTEWLEEMTKSELRRYQNVGQSIAISCPPRRKRVRK